MLLSLDSMETSLRKAFPLLQQLYPNVEMEEVIGADHFYTDGLSVGSCFKLIFSRVISKDITRHITTVYMFPSCKWFTTIKSDDITSIVRQWLLTTTEGISLSLK